MTRRISYRLSLAVAIPLLVAVTGAAVIWYAQARARAQIERSTATLFERVSGQAGDQARAHLLRAAPVAELASRLLDEDEVIDREALARRFVAFLRANPDLSWVTYGDEHGTFTGAAQTAAGEARVNFSEIVDGKTVLHEYDVDAEGAWTLRRQEHDTGYDPRTRPFYALAKAKGRRVFTEPYIFYDQAVPGITCAVPRYVGGALAGVITVDFDLNHLSKFVAELRLSPRGEVVLFTPGPTLADEHLLAHPAITQDDVVGQRAEGALVTMAGVEDPPARAMAAAAAAGKRGFFSVDVHGARWFAAVTAIEIDDGVTWIVGAVAPESDFTAALAKDLRVMLLVNVAVLVVAVIAAILLAGAVSRPLGALVGEMGAIGEFRLDAGAQRHSVFREIEVMHDVLARTKGGLRSFAAYVPRDLVRSVLASGREAKLEGELRTLTVFFSDIRDFTTMAEQLEPRALVEVLGGYLDEVLRIVGAHYGTVDKFLGDGVMAFWGAPTETPDHAILACEAAVRIQRRLVALGDRLQTRIGLATGEVLVGNIGSHERMNYTVMGDCVNLASRLEGLNKQYGTSIMISESTAQAAGDRVITRPVDVVAVKGKVVAVRVHEVLGLPSDGDASVVELARCSTEGFERYLARDFTAAAAAFDAALAIRPDDPVATKFAARSRELAASPPPADWDGVFHATEK